MYIIGVDVYETKYYVVHEKELIKEGKIIAAPKDTSVSKMIGNLLKDLVDHNKRYIASRRNAIAKLKKSYNFGGQIRRKRKVIANVPPL